METLTYDQLTPQQQKVAYQSWKKLVGEPNAERVYKEGMDTIRGFADAVACDVEFDMENDGSITYLNPPLIDDICDAIEMAAHGEYDGHGINLPRVSGGGTTSTVSLTAAHRWNMKVGEVENICNRHLKEAKNIGAADELVTESEVRRMLEPMIEDVKHYLTSLYYNILEKAGHNIAENRETAQSMDAFRYQSVKKSLRFDSEGNLVEMTV